MDGSPVMDCSTFHPARAMYSRAAALSLAVLDVVLPISRAAASSMAYSSSVAPAVAATEDIAASNSDPTLTLAAPTPTIAVAVAAMAFAVSLKAAPAAFPTAPNPAMSDETREIAEV